MEATLLSSHHSLPQLYARRYSGNSSAVKAASTLHIYQPRYAKIQLSLKKTYSELSRRNFVIPQKPHCSKLKKDLSVAFRDQLRGDYTSVKATSADSLSQELFVPNVDGLVDDDKHPDTSLSRPPTFKNRFLNFVRLGTLLNNATESFFKSEIRRRLFVTVFLLVMSRVGYFIPLPGFDRKLMPVDYLNFVSGSIDEVGDFGQDLKLSIFHLGIGPQIVASITMQVLCHIIPSLVKLRKEGLDGHEKIKSYIWWISLWFATLQGLILACYSLPYSIYAESYRVKHVMVTTFLLVCGAMTMNWISDKISDSGFGQGSSLIICVGIMSGYKETVYKFLTQVSGISLSQWPYVLAVLGIFTVVTMYAVVVTEGCRKIKLQYYGFKLASSARLWTPEMAQWCQN